MKTFLIAVQQLGWRETFHLLIVERYLPHRSELCAEDGVEFDPPIVEWYWGSRRIWGGRR
jgi:hypothetical protein